ncbi:OmpA family protein [Ferruginibacter sp. SUN002]|uniref:OmpA family protein n=1 Tax=Ferruginibacter sp. SUN002 TaxID=2937789 RepID=UPI003D36328D
MKRGFFYTLSILLFPFLGISQNTPVTTANVPKDAKIDVSMVDAKSRKILPNEIVVFKSQANGTEFQGLTDPEGKFTLRLPVGTKYDIFILGFKDSISYNVLDIPALGPNQFYKGTFANIDIEFEAPGSFVLDHCTFESGKATLKDEAYPVLDELVEYLKRKEDERVEIGGHTDNVGTAAKNLILSQDRANTVRAYLLMKGIAPDRVTAKGYGLTQPIDDNTTEEGRSVNRRTEVKTLD